MYTQRYIYMYTHIYIYIFISIYIYIYIYICYNYICYIYIYVIYIIYIHTYIHTYIYIYYTLLLFVLFCRTSISYIAPGWRSAWVCATKGAHLGTPVPRIGLAVAWRIGGLQISKSIFSATCRGWNNVSSKGLVFFFAIHCLWAQLQKWDDDPK